MHDFYAYHPCHWGETTDEERFFDLPSGLLGRNHGQWTIFIHLIRATGEKSRTGYSNYTLCRYFRPKVTEVYRKTRTNIVLVYRPGIKQPKSCQSVFQNTTRQAQDKAFSNMDPYWLTEVLFNIGSHRHKSICASLQVSLSQIDLNRWLAYLPAVMPANYLAVCQHICQLWCPHTSLLSAGVFADRGH